MKLHQQRQVKRKKPALTHQQQILVIVRCLGSIIACSKMKIVLRDLSERFPALN